MPKLNVGRLLEDNGLTLSGVNEDGSYQVQDSEGNARRFDLPKLMKDQGLRGVDVEANTPDTPLDSSPVGLMDRLKLAVGNTKGQVGYLRQKFEDVSVHPDNGLLVKNKGVWQKVDQSGMDAWELTKDVAEGAVSLAPSLVGGTLGAAAGTAVAGPVGSVAGAGVGAGIAETVRTSLGRLAGTYQATPEEQLKDIGIETLLNSGGQTVALGVKPALSLLAKGARQIRDVAAPASRELLEGVYGTLTGAGQTATKVLFKDPDNVVREMGRALQAGGGRSDAAIEFLKQSQVDDALRLVEKARPRLRETFRQLEEGLLKEVPDDFVANPAEIVRSVQRQLAEEGLGKFEPIKAVVGLAERNPRAAGEAIDHVFKVAGPEDIEKLIARGGLPDRAAEPILEAVSRLNNELNRWSRMPARTGKEAAKAALAVKRAVNQTSIALQQNVDPITRSRLAQISSSIDSQLSELFYNKGLGQSFDRMNSFYSGYKSVVDEAQRILHETNGAEIFVNKLISNPGSQATAKSFSQMARDLVGPEGEQLLRSIAFKEGAKGYVRVWPNPGKLTAALGAGAAGFGVATGAVSAPMAAAGAAMASPRLVAKQVQYGQKLLGFIQGMNPAQRVQWLRDPNAVRITFSTLMDAQRNEEQAYGELMNQVPVRQ